MTATAPEGVEPRPARTLAAYRSVLSLATFGMLALSWPLWVGAGAIPRVPFFRGLPDLPAVFCGATWLLVLAGLAASAAGIAWRAATLMSVALLGGLVLLDQNRLQPWVYQYLVTGLALATTTEVWGARLARLFLIALYVHSGLSKLDLTFADELGRLFLRTGLEPLGLDPEGWPIAARRAAALGMAGFELSIGLGLAFRPTRRLAMVGAAALHLTLLGLLGPWGLDHSAIVLAWNAAVLVEDLILFRGVGAATPAARPTDRHARPAAAWLVVAAAVLPFGERWGWWDTWPSFAVYASHNQRTEIYVHRDDLRALPSALRRHAHGTEEGPWLRIDLTGWSREARGVPFYPSARVGDATALWLAERSRTIHPIRVVHLGRAERLTGRREREESVGPEAIRGHTARYWLNARPADDPRGPGRWGFGMDRAEPSRRRISRRHGTA